MEDSRKEIDETRTPSNGTGAARPPQEVKNNIPHSSVTHGSLTGATIGHYLVGERLGGGSMAAVYRAHDNHLDRSVAIKVLLPGADANMQARFRREARLVSDLVHPNIVRTLQVGRSGGIIYIAMELVEGVSLGELLDKEGQIPVSDAAHILAPIANSLAYAHEKGIVHRDVKPSNILLRRANPGAPNSVAIASLPYSVVPLLSDFGIARALDAPELTSAGRTIGTPAFMAPEQCAGSSDIDGRADEYALGAVLYRCIVGRPPFSGSTTQILHAHVYDPLLIPDAVAVTLPAPIVRIIARAMMKEPSQRFEHIEQMATELEAAADMPLPSVPKAPEIPDATMTMASLPVTKSPTTPSRVLVPAATVAARTPASNPVARAIPAQNSGGRVTTAPQAIVLPPARKRANRNGWGIMALGGAFVALVLIAAIIFVNTILPVEGSPEVVASTPTAVAIAQANTPEVPVAAATVPPQNEAENPVTPVAVTPVAVTPVNDASSTPGVTATVEAGVATPVSKPVELSFAWELAKGFYDEGDWEQAAAWLIQIVPILDVPVSANPNEPTAEELNIARNDVVQMLVVSYIGLSTDAVKVSDWDSALDKLDSAITISPKSALLPMMRGLIEDLSKLVDVNEQDIEEKRSVLRHQLATLLNDFSQRLEAAGKLCEAALQVDNAFAISATNELNTRKALLESQCSVQRTHEALLESGGTMIYSSERADNSGISDIWAFALDTENLDANNSYRLVENGAEPSLRPNGSLLAYHNTADGGVWGIAVDGNLQASGAPTRYSPNVEDSRDSPPSWRPGIGSLAFSTTFNGTAPVIFETMPGDDNPEVKLLEGKDPAWNPSGDMLAFNGYENGLSPGLFYATSNGDRVRLTTNGNDQRPTWTPDGNSVVFMSKDRPDSPNGNWEIYRHDWQTKNFMRLTDGDDAQDGLPTVSPDGKWVAFMSDRGGTWRIWFVGIDGGPVQLLSEINGQPISWLEHSIQWVK